MCILTLNVSFKFLLNCGTYGIISRILGSSGICTTKSCISGLLQDKLGPFCRSAKDCAIILDCIRGKDPNDPSSKNIHLEDPFSIDITKLTVGYLEDADQEVSESITWANRALSAYMVLSSMHQTHLLDACIAHYNYGRFFYFFPF